jgi:hypothetical protein
MVSLHLWRAFKAKTSSTPREDSEGAGAARHAVFSIRARAARIALLVLQSIAFVFAWVSTLELPCVRRRRKRALRLEWPGGKIYVRFYRVLLGSVGFYEVVSTRKTNQI